MFLVYNNGLFFFARIMHKLSPLESMHLFSCQTAVLFYVVKIKMKFLFIEAFYALQKIQMLSELLMRNASILCIQPIAYNQAYKLCNFVPKNPPSPRPPSTTPNIVDKPIFSFYKSGCAVQRGALQFTVQCSEEQCSAIKGNSVHGSHA